ncbi:beta-sandwich domain-containing protein [Bdellovibrio bacteriovorus]|uniref:beta-sandwich domain-containing protein n=1 Tax=Bdellovibrio bacteriovorus TaxID=959 RepID=UPI0035A72E65
MKRRLIATVLATLSMMQNAHADIISDLPGFDDVGGGMEFPQPPQEQGADTTTTTTSSTATSTVQRQYTGDVQVREVSRKKDGEIRKITLAEALTLQNMEIKARNARVKIHEVTLILANGQRSDVREYRNAAVLEINATASSGNLNLNQKVAAIEIRAESYGGISELSVKAVSDLGVPRMTAQGPAVAQPVTPTAPPAPGRTEESATVRVGDKVLFDNGSSYVGTVKEIFMSGKARVSFPGYSQDSILDLKDLARSVNCQATQCVGDRVLFDNGNQYVGMISMVFANGVRQVKFPGYSEPSFIKAQKLTKSAQCAGSVCVGERIIFSNGSDYYAGTVREAFVNGMVSIKFDGYNEISFLDHKKLMKGQACASDICVDTRVMFDNGSGNYLGRVTEIYADGTAKIKFEGYSEYSFIKTSRLVKVVSSVKGYSSGTRVLFNNGSGYYVGTVREVFADGTASIRFEGYSDLSFIKVDRLGRQADCHKNICTGNRVILNGQYSGTVRAVYSNGYALVKYDGYTDLTYTDVSKLSR